MTAESVANTKLTAHGNGQVGPVSYTQEQLWLVEQLSSSGNLYNECWAIRFRGDLDVDTLTWCVNEFVARHDILRTIFPLVEGRPVQRVLPVVPLSLDVVDLSGRSAPIDAMIALAHEEVERPYDHAHSPPRRFKLLRLGPRDHVLLLAMHHMLGDGTSADILIRELNQLYPNRLAGRSATLPELKLQYRDFARWQRNAVESGALADDAAYWDAKLAGVRPLRLPSDRPRPTFKGEAGDRRRFDLGRELSADLHAFARDRAVTPYVVMIATFSALLRRYVGVDDLLFGLASGRVDAELADLFGHFAQTVPIRLQVDGDLRFDDLLARARDTVLEGLDHRYLPFEKLVELVRPERDPTHTPIVQVHFASRQLPTERLDLTGLEASWFEIPRSRSRFDLIVEVDTRAGELEAWVEFDTQLFDDASVSLLMGRYRRFVRTVLNDPGIRLSQLPMADDRELELLESWTCRALRSPVPDVLEQAAAASGNHADLLSRTGRISDRLSFTDPALPVVVCPKTAADVPATLLATLRGGRTALVVDPSHSPERWAALVDRLPGAVVVTTGGASSPAGLGVTLDLGDGDPLPAPAEAEIRSAPVPTAPAIVQPSLEDVAGIVVDRATVSALVAGVAELLPPGARALQATPTDMLGCLFILGACVAGADGRLVDALEVMSAESLVSALRTTGVSAAMLDPTALEQLDPDRLPDLTTIFVRTRPSASVVRRWGGRKLWLWHTVGGQPFAVERLQPHDEDRWAVLRPLSDTPPIVVSDGALAPICVPGQLCVRVSAGCAVLADPMTTAARYGPDPSSDNEGGLVLRTGQQGRWTPAGALELVGQPGGGVPDVGSTSPGPPGAAADRTIEAVVAKIFSDLLGVSAVGPDGDFFALGGHSIVAVDMVERIRAEVGIDIPIRAVFENPTVSGLAAYVANAYERAATPIVTGDGSATPKTDETPIDESPHPGQAVPLSATQEQIWVAETLTPGTLAYTLPYRLRVSGPLDIATLREAFATTIARHDALRASFHSTAEGVPFQVVLSDVPIEVPVIDHSDVAADRREQVADEVANAESERPFDLTEPPLVRLTIVRFGPTDHLVAVTFHHLVNDLVSTRLFFRDLTNAYTAAHDGSPEKPPDQPVRYADYIRYARDLLTRANLTRLEAFWRDVVVDAQPMALPLDPTERGRGQGRAVVTRTVSRRTMDAVYRLARAERVTPFMVLAAVFANVLASWTNRDDLMFGIPTDNRHGQGANEVMGCFTNVVPLRITRDATWRLRDLVRHVRAQTLAAYRHQALPTTRIVRLAGNRWSNDGSPLLRVSFAMSSFEIIPVRFGSATIDVDFADGGRGSYDLSLHCHSHVDRLQLRISYRSELWRESTVRDLLDSFTRRLRQVTAAGGGEQRLADLELDTT